MAIYTITFGVTYANVTDADIGAGITVNSVAKGTLICFDNTAKMWHVNSGADTIVAAALTYISGTVRGGTSTRSITQPVEVRVVETKLVTVPPPGYVKITDLVIAMSFIQLFNIIPDSQYYITHAVTGAILASGTASTSTVTTPNFNFFGNFQANVVIRKGTSPIKYKPYTASVIVTGKGGVAYIQQEIDPIA
jgi:hypothetical protein